MALERISATKSEEYLEASVDPTGAIEASLLKDKHNISSISIEYDDAGATHKTNLFPPFDGAHVLKSLKRAHENILEHRAQPKRQA